MAEIDITPDDWATAARRAEDAEVIGHRWPTEAATVLRSLDRSARLLPGGAVAVGVPGENGIEWANTATDPRPAKAASLRAAKEGKTADVAAQLEAAAVTVERCDPVQIVRSQGVVDPVAASDIAQRTGTTLDGVAKWRRRGRRGIPFPEPVGMVGGRPVWRWAAVARWVADTTR